MADPIAAIVNEIISRLAESEYRPFAILLSDGSRHFVPTRDHCVVTRILRRIEVEYDDGMVTQVNPLHITRLETAQKPAA